MNFPLRYTPIRKLADDPGDEVSWAPIFLPLFLFFFSFFQCFSFLATFLLFFLSASQIMLFIVIGVSRN